ncbi:MAG: glycosyltransferase family 9 protein [Candidatus Kaistia colombiensis]|nr:MAG: glycosyltransferase family 9 protein [Kaistia sp.]
MWRTDRWIALCNRLIAQDFDIVLLGDTHDAETCNAIADGLPGASFVNRAGQMTLPEVAEAIADSALFIGLDTGLSHIASSTGSPALVLFSGHADHEVWAPDGPDVSILRNDVPCAPCHATRMTQCLFKHRCMDIPLDFVWQAASAKLDDGQTVT